VSRALWTLVVLGATLLFHLPARHGEFLSYDDGRYVVRNDAIDRVGNPLRFFTDPETLASADAPTQDIYRPLRTLSFAVLTQAFGKTPGPFHVAAVVGHAIAAALLFALLRRLALPDWAAAAGALAWGLHPVTVEVTAWVCSLGDVGCGVFVLLAMLAHADRRRVLAVSALGVALFWKEHAVVVPGLWLAWDFLVRRERLRDGLVRAVLPGAVVVLAFLLWRGSLGTKMAQVPEPLGGSHASAVLTMLAGLGWYAMRLLLPFGPSFDARVAVPASLIDPAALLGLAVLAGLGFACFRGPRTSRLGAAWFLIALVPVSNVLVPLKIPTADRFLYLPAMGAALLGAAWATRLPRPARWALPAGGLLLGALTVVRIGDWRDDATLLAAGKAVSPRSKTWLWAEAALSAQRALALLREGAWDRAAPMVDETGELYSRYLRNAVPAEKTPVLMEAADFYDEVARHCDRVDLESEALRAWGQALDFYRGAHALHVASVGRVIDVERERAAERIVGICLRLADPENPQLGQVVKVGMDALGYVEREFGRDIRAPYCQFLIVGSREIRVRDTAKAREALDFALRTLADLEREGVPVAFLQAQAHYYRGILLDEGVDRDELELAWTLFGEAEQQLPENRLTAMVRRARIAFVIADHAPGVDDAQRADWEERGLALLEAVPDAARELGQKVPKRIEREVAFLEKR